MAARSIPEPRYHWYSGGSSLDMPCQVFFPSGVIVSGVTTVPSEHRTFPPPCIRSPLLSEPCLTGRVMYMINSLCPGRRDQHSLSRGRRER